MPLKLCMEGLPGKVGRCVTVHPIGWPPHKANSHGAAIEESGLYPEIIVDASILSAIHDATKGVTDKGTRDALAKGVESALTALRKRGGKEVTSITLDD